MRVFYGAAIQGAKDRAERAHVHKRLIKIIKEEGHEVVSEHLKGRNKEETAKLLEESLGPLPPSGIERKIRIRKKLLEYLEGNIDAAVFECSIPSLGTGIELSHAYLRPRKGLDEIPILGLYEEFYWPSGLSSMGIGITPEELPNFNLIFYKNLKNAEYYVRQFVKKINQRII